MPSFNNSVFKAKLVLTQYQDIFFPSGQKLLLLPPICLDLNSVRRLSHLERSVLQLDTSWSPAL
jgi:hypothetical protein